MRDITYLKEHYHRYHSILIQKQFKSKKNTVAYVLHQGKPRVFKWYAPGFKANMTTELSILNQTTLDLTIPTLFSVDKRHHLLIMSYIPGKNLCDLINAANITLNEKKRLIHLLASWIATFHQYFKKQDRFLIHGDTTLRNYLFTDRIWGVDFEECRQGKPIEDIAQLCTSIITTNPMAASYKFQLCNHLISTYKKHVPWNLENLFSELSYALIQCIPYRPQEEPQLRNLADTIHMKLTQIQ